MLFGWKTVLARVLCTGRLGRTRVHTNDSPRPPPTDIYRVREKKDVYVLKLLKVNLEGSGTARAEFDSEARILAQLQARIHPGTNVVCWMLMVGTVIL